MSNPTSVLAGKVESAEVTVSDAGLQGMITLRGDLSDKALQAVCKQLTGLAVPKSGKIATDNDKGIGWMSPDELLLLVPHDTVGDALATINSALAGTHHLAVNVSDARGLITVTGPYAREVIAKLSPADVSPEAFQPGDLRRTRLGQVAAAFWMTDETTFQMIYFRSVADYAFNLLAASAKAGPVGHLSPN